ncbi:MAG: cytidine deaminase [Armatimonadetes bacterium]|nr:cytidine deaminase [Armatimonadota bacterium]
MGFEATKPSKDRYYTNIADSVAQRCTCLRRCYGAVIVKSDRIVSTGFNGAPRGVQDSLEAGWCRRIRMGNGVDGQRSNYMACRAVHAEMNAIISASTEEMAGATLYVAGRNKEPLIGFDNQGYPLKELTTAWEDLPYAKGSPCQLCARMILNAGIERVVFREVDGSLSSVDPKEWTVNTDILFYG